MNYKYLILFPIPEPFNTELCVLMDEISTYTALPSPYKKLPPHVTFHRPLEGIDENLIKNLAQSMVLQIRQTRMTVSHLFPFGKQFIVLPVHATRRLATLWVGINTLLSSLPEYEHGEFDHDNTLHITIAEKTTVIFDSIWKKIEQITINSMTIPVEKIEIYRKPVLDGVWERILELTIPE